MITHAVTRTGHTRLTFNFLTRKKLHLATHSGIPIRLVKVILPFGFGAPPEVEQK